MSVPCAARLLRNSCKATCVRIGEHFKVLANNCEQQGGTEPTATRARPLYTKHVECRVACRSRGPGVSLAW